MDYTKPTQEGIIDKLVKTYRTYHDTQLIPDDMKAAFNYWEDLFTKYNEASKTAKDPGHFPLKMGCRACYMKVWMWARKTNLVK